MTEYLFSFLYLATDVLAILLLVATWQQTHVFGFMVLAITHLAHMLVRWLTPLLYRLAGGEDMLQLGWLLQSLYWLIALAGVYGLWDIYRQFRRKRAPIVPPA